MKLPSVTIAIAMSTMPTHLHHNHHHNRHLHDKPAYPFASYLRPSTKPSFNRGNYNKNANLVPASISFDFECLKTAPSQTFLLNQALSD
ncbi:hypothetical protein QVD17_09132 [Tagetes erecta]|uniref:Uncharacterized protein n=1 Tax=Tagetes erecta TaxID=13708 RepID=A0AAD8L0C8_TARER|nr:hypothetical protein QVD17_09132 [Tagetes erecta]